MSNTTCVRSVDVYDRLRRELLLKQIKPGSFIDVREKSEIYGTSTVPIREALLCLSESGLLVRERNRGFLAQRFCAEEVLFAYDALRHLAEYFLERADYHVRHTIQEPAADGVHDGLGEPYFFLQKLIGSAARLFRPHSVRQFILNLNVVSTTWEIEGEQLLIQNADLSHLIAFNEHADGGNLRGAAQQLQRFCHSYPGASIIPVSQRRLQSNVRPDLHHR
nr:GntR family transcriptional regulator [Brucella anthropi]